MKGRSAAIAAILLCVACRSGFSIEPVALRSYSGQFFVRGLPLGAPLMASAPTSSVSYVRLDPTLLAVSCERIKSAVLEELAMKDSWRGKILISLHPLRDDHEPIVVTAVHYTDGWNYQMEIPEQVDGARLIKSVVEVVLLEMANRSARSLAAELPLWLTEGFAAHLQTTVLPNFTLEPETRIARKERIHDPLGPARERLRGHRPLMLNELNWPSEEQLAEENLPTYQSCAHLFVYELLRLRDGRACLREMLAHLPEKLNWQTAFLRAFSPHFQSLLDVDKWWSLHAVHFSGQGPLSAWVREESWKQLEDILSTPVRIRLSPQALPFNSQVNLQTILAEWDFQPQRALVLEKLNLLQALRLRASQDSADLVESYRQALDAYVQNRSKTGGRKGKMSPEARLVVSDTIKRLDFLDTRRGALSSTISASGAITSAAISVHAGSGAIAAA